MMHSESSSAPAAAAGLDEGFLRRVHVMGLAFAGLGALLTTFYVSQRFGAGFGLAALWSVCNLWVLERLLRAAVRPAGRDVGTIVLAGLVKLPILYGLIVLLVLKGGFPGSAMAFGLSVPLLVIVLKVLGRALVARQRATENGPAGLTQSRS